MAAAAPAGGPVGGGSAVVPTRTLLDDLLDSILTPGAGPGLVATINGSLLLLVGVLLALVATGSADVHTGVMLFLALGLLGSVNFFIAQVRKQAGSSSGGGGDDDGVAAPAVAPEAAADRDGGEVDSSATTPSSGRGSAARRRRRE